MDGLAHQIVLRVVGTDPETGSVWVDRAISWRSWGEHVRIDLRASGPDRTRVTIESSSKTTVLTDWGAHGRNFHEVHEAIERGLAMAYGPPPSHDVR
jgi:hypothetical protein